MLDHSPSKGRCGFWGRFEYFSSFKSGWEKMEFRVYGQVSERVCGNKSANRWREIRVSGVQDLVWGAHYDIISYWSSPLTGYLQPSSRAPSSEPPRIPSPGRHEVRGHDAIPHSPPRISVSIQHSPHMDDSFFLVGVRLIRMISYCNAMRER